MVISLILCNTFSDTTSYSKGRMPSVYYMMPTFALRRQILAEIPSVSTTGHMADSVDFMVEQVEKIDRSTLASRLVIRSTRSYIEPQRLRHQPITIIESFDDPGTTPTIQEDLHKCYPDARKGQLKSGGPFPYLSAAHEVNLYILIHLKSFVNTKLSPYEKSTEPLNE
eukprot:sb/3472366/